MIVVPQEGAKYFIEKIFNKEDKIVLFVNNLTPKDSTNFGQIVEPSSGCYKRITLDGEWTIYGTKAIYAHPSTETFFGSLPITNVDPYAENVKFINCGTPNDPPWTVYGYAIKNWLTDEIIWIERFEEPLIMPEWGGIVAIEPRIKLKGMLAPADD